MNDRDLAALVRRADPDRFLGALFAPVPERHWLFALYAFNHELARAREVASEPTLALIRLQWWHEVVEGAARAHPIAELVHAGVAANVFDTTVLGALIDAREAEAAPISDCTAFLAYARGTSGGLARTAGRVLGVHETGELEALADLGTGYAIAAILRMAPALVATGRDLLPQDGTEPAELREIASGLLTRRASRAGLAAALPAVLARRDLRRPGFGRISGTRGLADRVALITAGFRGRC